MITDAMLQDIKRTFWATANKLRANMDAAEYKHLVFGRIFLKHVSDTFISCLLSGQLRLSDSRAELEAAA